MGSYIDSGVVHEHMRVLHASGLVTAKRIKQWTFYRRNDERLAAIASIVDAI